jgi:ribose transport system permease protein
MVVLVVVVGFLMRHTRYGRRATGVGGNPVAAKARGISLRRVRFGVFTSAGALVGVAALLFTGTNASFTPIDGATYLLPVIAAVILAGISLSGGRGNLWLILLSVGFLSTVPTALVFFGLSDAWQAVLQGIILIVAVSIDGRRQRKERR